MVNDIEKLYDAVTNGRVKLEDLSDKGLNALKSYVYTKDKNFSTEQPQAAKMTELAKSAPKTIQNYNYADAKMPDAAMRGQQASIQAERNRNYNYPSTQPEVAKIQSDNVRARYTGTPPEQAKVGQSFKPDLPNFAAAPNYMSIRQAPEKGLFESLGDARRKSFESPQAFQASLGQFISGVTKGASLGLSDSKLVPDFLRQAEDNRTAILGKQDSDTIKNTGEIFGSLLPGVGAYNLASKAVSKLPKMGKLATSATKGALSGLGYQTTVEAVDQAIGREPNTLADSALNIGLATGIGAVADPLIMVAPEAVRKLSKRAKDEVAGIAANLLTRMNQAQGQQRASDLASQFGGTQGMSKQLTGQKNMKRFQDRMVTEDQIQSLRRQNADEVLREIADQQNRYIERYNQLNQAFESFPSWEKQRAMELYNQSIKDQPKMEDFNAENIRMNRQKEIESTLTRLAELDETFKDSPTELQMAMEDYNKQVKSRGQLMDQRQKELNRTFKYQPKIDNYQIERERILTEAFDQLPQAEKERLLQEYLERAKQMPKIQDMTLDNMQAKYRDEVTPLFERELNRQDQADAYARMFDEIQQRERQAELQNTPRIGQFNAENLRQQREQSLNDILGPIAEREAQRQDYVDNFSRLMDAKDGGFQKARDQAKELSDEVQRIDDYLDQLDARKEAEVKQLTEGIKFDYEKNRGGTRVVLDEERFSGGLTLPNTDNGIIVSDNPLWYQKWSKENGYRKMNKKDYEKVAREMIEKGKFGGYDGSNRSFEDVTGISQERNAILSVRDELVSEIERLYGNFDNLLDDTNQISNVLESLPKQENAPQVIKASELPVNNKSVTSPVSKIPSKKKDVKPVENIPTKQNDFVSIDDAVKQNRQAAKKMIQAQEQQMNILGMNNRMMSGIDPRLVKSSDQQIESTMNATKNLRQTIKESLIQKGKDLVEGSKNIYRSYFRYRDDLKFDPKLQNVLRKGENNPQEARDWSQEQIETITSTLRDKPEFNVFRRLLMLSDFEQDALKGLEVPGGLELNQIQDEIKRLKSIATPGVRTALDNHVRLMQSVGMDLERRGKMAAGSTRDIYYPHRVLDYVDSLDKVYGNTRSIRTPNRFYTLKREGTKRLIEADYVQVMFNALYKVRNDNLTDELVAKVVRDRDKTAEFKQLQEPAIKINGVITGPDGNMYKNWTYNGTTYLLDDRIAKNLQQFVEVPNQSPLLKVGSAFTNWWKRITLDFAGLPFHFTNFLGDALALYRDDPFALVDVKNIVKANRMLLKDRANLTDEELEFLRLASDERIFQSGITQGMLSKAFPKQPVQNRFTPNSVKFLYWMNPFNVLESISNTREQLPRLIKFLRDAQRIQKGENIPLDKKIRSKILDVNDLKDKGLSDIEIAGIVNREGFIDYSKLSPFARSEMSGFLFPFFTFYTQNFKNWAKYVAKNPTDMLVKFGIPTAGMMYWNNVVQKETEMKLPDYIRDVPHLITGWKDENGNPFVLKFNTPFNAAENLLALNKIPRMAFDSAYGSKTMEEGITDQTKETLLAPLKQTWGLLNPLLSTPVEVYANRDSFTGGKITPERLVGTDEDVQRRTEFAIGNLFTPFGVYRQYERSNLEPKEGFTDTLGQVLYQQFLDPQRALGRFIDLTKVERNKQFDLAEKIDTKQKESKLKVEEAYIQSRLLGNNEAFVKAAQESGLSQNQIKPIIESPRVRLEIVKAKLKKEKDPTVRKRLLSEKSKLEELQQRLSQKMMPESARKEMMEGRQ